MSAEHNDGIVRTPYLKKMYGEKVYKIFEDIKNKKIKKILNKKMNEMSIFFLSSI